MRKGSKQTFQKREKEKQRQQRARDKEAQRLANKERRANSDSGPNLSDEDPDLAGIRPGPQPLPEQWRYAEGVEPDEEEEEAE